MTIRGVFSAFFVLSGLGLLAVSPGCGDQGVGDPCVPESEYDPSFLGFVEGQTNIESKSFQCRTRVCLVNHFRGRVSCPYGQDSDRTALQGASPCAIPGKRCDPATGAGCVTGLTDPNNADSFRDPVAKALVPPQCRDRTADKTVYCSCRCADINGQKPSDQSFCDCPDGFTCETVVTSIGQGISEGLTGSYCIKTGTKFDPILSCTQGDCDPSAAKCL